MSNFLCFQYNQEIHYVEPCLNGTLVQADSTNKDVCLSFIKQWHTLAACNYLIFSEIRTPKTYLKAISHVLIHQHFKEHLDKLFAKGIGLLGNALSEAFTILNEVSEDYQNREITEVRYHDCPPFCSYTSVCVCVCEPAFCLTVPAPPRDTSISPCD